MGTHDTGNKTLFLYISGHTHISYDLQYPHCIMFTQKPSTFN